MSNKVRLVRSCVIGALLSGTALVSPSGLVQMAAAAEPAPAWWSYGTVEVGGRFFLNNPERNGSAYLNQKSLAKFYEYSTNKPGPFGNVNVSTGSNDGWYRLDFTGTNIGYSDQSYSLDASKAGEHYVSFGWDETPHIRSTSAQTIYNGVGTGSLTLPSGYTKTAEPAANGSTASNIGGYLHQTDIGFRRDTASGSYRWTPSDAWDINADYSHLTRKGTWVDGIVGFGNTGGSGGNTIEVPKPIDDTTQNFGLNGEYAGTSPWGKKLTLKVGYQGSQYTDNLSSYTVENPWTTPAATLLARESLPPSNKANGFNGTLALDLPFKSRYVGTASYTMMRQDADFQPFSVNAPALLALPASSLNGAINTTLINNVMTTQIAPDLKSKLAYRYYNFDNETPEIYFPNGYVRFDSTAISATPRFQSTSLGYQKHNADAELNWRPSREWNLTAGYGYERNFYTRADADSTHENTGKLSADWKPTNWLTARAFGSFSDRRVNSYDNANFLRAYMYPGQNACGAGWCYSDAYRQFMFSNRQRTIGKFAIDMVVARGITITPTFKYQDDNYGLDSTNGSVVQTGLNARRDVSAGLDVTYAINRDLSVMAGYMREHIDQSLFGRSSSYNGGTVTNTSDKADVDTVTAMVKYAAIPDKFDLDLRYTFSRSTDQSQLFLAGRVPPTGGQFPTNITQLQRAEATGIYKFDKTQINQLGWKGDVKAKVRYAWERNSDSNWQNDPLWPYNQVGLGRAVFMAYDNPNYSVHMMSASLIFSW